MIWNLSRQMKAYCRVPEAALRESLISQFDRIFNTQTGFAALDKLLARLRGNKAELLVALSRPEVPLHTNSAERAIRCQVIKRKISGGTHSMAGRDARDAFLGLLQTCAKLGISFWDYLADRLGDVVETRVPPLAELIGAQTSSA